MYNKASQKLLSNPIAPMWLIFFLDLSICCFAGFIAYLLRFNFNLKVLFDYPLLDGILIMMVVSAMFFYALKTYKGIIRFSGLAEALRGIVALFFTTAILLMANGFTIAYHLANLVPTSVLIMYFFIGSFLIAGYRFYIKTIYRKTIKSGAITNVVIYGGETNGVQLKNTLEQNSNYGYQVISFIDDDQKFIGKLIDGIPIRSFGQIKYMMEAWNVKLMLFAKPEMEVLLKRELVEFCLNHDIQVRNIPSAEKWRDGNFSISQLKEVEISELLGRVSINLEKEKTLGILKNKRILITGAAGSIGSEIAEQLAAIQPSLLILCDQTETGLHDLEYKLRSKFPTFINMVMYISDVRDVHAMEHLFAKYKPSMVFHAAAYKHVPIMEFHPSEAIRNNVLGTKILADLSVEYDVERFLLVSTDKAINPTNIMGASKRLAEIYIQSLGNRNKKVVHLSSGIHSKNSGSKKMYGSTKFITTRFGNVLDSNGSVIPRFKEQITNGGPVTVTHPDISRYFMTIPEACSLVLEAMTMGNGGEIMLFDMGEPIKIVDLAKKMIRLSGFVPGKDIDIRYIGLRPGEKLFEELFNHKEQMIPTHNKKILIAKVAEYDFYQINKAIDELIAKAVENKDEEVVRKMKAILPEFISNNPDHNNLDIDTIDTKITTN